MNTRVMTLGLAASLSLYACGPIDDDLYDDPDFRSSGGIVAADAGLFGGIDTIAPPGRPGGGGWISNGLSDPSVSGINPGYPLNTTLGMSETVGMLCYPDKRGIAEYIVECALPAGRTITKNVDGQTHTLNGRLGLAPQWETGSCDNDCQQWVSACLLARTNTSEQFVDVWIQADHPAIGFGLPEGNPVMVHEASYYGNLFWTGSFLYYCEGAQSGEVAATRMGRTCSTGDCGFTSYASCSQVQERCTMAGPGGDVPVECRSEQAMYGPTWHTISTYLPG